MGGRLLAAIASCLAALPARADMPPPYADNSPAELAEAAFATPYGKTLAAEAGRIVLVSSDPACAREKGLTDEAIKEGARRLLVHNGTRLLELTNSLLDPVKFHASVERLAGTRAKADFEKLRNDPEVRALIEASNPPRFARLAENITEMVDRHALLARVHLVKHLSPLATGDAALLDEGEKAQSTEAVERFIDEHPSAAMKRWMQIAEALLQATQDASDSERLVRLGPIQMMPDVAKDLAALCVPRN